jgi:hypothetical protein
MTAVASDFDDGAMSLPMNKLTLPPDLCEDVDRRVLLGGFVNAGDDMRQLIRSDARAPQDGRLRDSLASHRSGGDSVPGNDSRRGTDWPLIVHQLPISHFSLDLRQVGTENDRKVTSSACHAALGPRLTDRSLH